MNKSGVDFKEKPLRQEESRSEFATPISIKLVPCGYSWGAYRANVTACKDASPRIPRISGKSVSYSVPSPKSDMDTWTSALIYSIPRSRFLLLLWVVILARIDLSVLFKIKDASSYEFILRSFYLPPNFHKTIMDIWKATPTQHAMTSDISHPQSELSDHTHSPSTTGGSQPKRNMHPCARCAHRRKKASGSFYE